MKLIFEFKTFGNEKDKLTLFTSFNPSFVLIIIFKFNFFKKCVFEIALCIKDFFYSTTRISERVILKSKAIRPWTQSEKWANSKRSISNVSWAKCLNSLMKSQNECYCVFFCLANNNKSQLKECDYFDKT